MVRIKSCPKFFKLTQKVGSAVFTEEGMFFKIAKKKPNFWATFERKFVPKIIQKSPDLSTLNLNATAQHAPILTNLKVVYVVGGDKYIT